MSTSSQSDNNVAKNRLSLPKSVPSTTVVTQSNVDRRRSIRRSMAKENEHHSDSVETPSKKRKYDNENDHDVTHEPEYSPPETRSASKKKKTLLEINPDFFDAANQSNALLQFSPPDQKRNAQREQERIRQKEEARYVSMCICIIP